MGWGYSASVTVRKGEFDLKNCFREDEKLKLKFLESLDLLAENEVIIPDKIEKPVFFKELKFYKGLVSTPLDYFTVDEFILHDEIGLRNPLQVIEMLLAVSYFSTFLPEETFTIELGERSEFLLTVSFVDGHLKSLNRGRYDRIKNKFIPIKKEIPSASDGFSASSAEFLDFFKTGVKERLRPTVLPNYLDKFDIDSAYIDLSKKNLSRISPEISRFKKLKGINLNYNRLRKIPEELFNLPELEELHLENNKISSIPPEIEKLKNLKTLSLGNNNLIKLPEEICNLHILKKLKLESNKLQSLPEQFGQLEQLEELTAYDNEIRSLPDSFCNLKSLFSFSIFRNKLEYLPESFGSLDALEQFSVEWNLITDLPESFSNLNRLKELDLSMSNNKFTSFPLSLTRMKNLEILKFGFLCKYTDLPEEIGQMKNLKILDLSLSKNLNKLPDSIVELSNLEELNIESTSVFNLPENSGNLKKLKSMLIKQTYILKLPKSVSNLKGLKISSDKGSFTIEGQESIEFFCKEITTKEEFNSFDHIERGNLYKFCSEELRSDKDFAWWLAENTFNSTSYNGSAFLFLGNKLKNDKSFALEYINKKGGNSLKFFSEELRSDWDILEAAFKKAYFFNIEDIYHLIPESVRQNPESLEKLFNINPNIRKQFVDKKN